MNIPTIVRNPGALMLFLAIVISGWISNGFTPAAQAQARAQQASSSTINLFLPLVANGSLGSPTKPDEATVTPTSTATTTPTATPTATPTTAPVPNEKHGLFALTDWLTYNGDSAVDANGGVHLVFYTSDERHADDKRERPAYYAYCPGPVSVCGDSSKWTGVVQMDKQANEIQIALTSTGKPRLLVRTNGSRGYDYHYWACDEQCTDAQRWAGVFVAEAMGSDGGSATDPQHSFALDAQDRPRFVYGNGWGNGRPTAIYYAFCDAADCTEPGSWQEVNIYGPIEFKTTTTDYSTLLFDGDKPRLITRLNYSGLPVSLLYMQCDQACDQHNSWHTAIVPHPDGNKQWANWDLVLDANGHPRVALYERADIDIHVGGKLFYGWCDENCSTNDNAFQLVQVASGEGPSVDLEIDNQGRTHMVYDAGQRGVLGHLWCDSNCTSAERWQRRILKTNEELLADFAPAIPFTCDQQTAYSWLDAIPSLTFDNAGKLVVAYDVKYVATCYYQDPLKPDPIITRVERIWWAVRWDYFAQP